MNEEYGHSRLCNRYVLRGELVCETAIHVGSGGTSDVLATSDMPVARDSAGRPYIPGSSFRGAFRSGLEALLRGLDRPGEELRVCDPLQKADAETRDEHEISCSNRIQKAREEETEQLSEERAFEIAWGDSCQVCRIFGNTFFASRVWIGDLRLLSDPEDAPTYLRDGVGLDRDLRSAARGVLYSFEAVPAGACFELRMEMENAADYELGLILTGLSLFENGFLSIGGKRARGLGMATVAEPSLVRWGPEDFFKQTGGRQLAPEELEGFRQKAYARYVEGTN